MGKRDEGGTPVVRLHGYGAMLAVAPTTAYG
jgi:hypothetical protein